MDNLLTIRQASEWASNYFNRNITPSNVSYLIQYGRIRKIGNNNNTRVFKKDLLKYYNSYYGKKEIEWKKELGDDLNWTLSFDQYSEKERTKHVHRLHPYKGKFIPQLVEYFLDNHIDVFKKETYFQKGDIVLDPFCGSGTTLIQANESGMHAIGIDISAFNAQISNVKVGKYNLYDLKSEINKINNKLAEFVYGSNSVKFEQELLQFKKDTY